MIQKLTYSFKFLFSLVYCLFFTADSVAFASNSSFQDGYFSLESPAQIYQYKYGSFDVVYNQQTAELKQTTSNSATSGVFNYEISTTATNYGGALTFPVIENFWIGFDYLSSSLTTELKTSNSSDSTVTTTNFSETKTVMAPVVVFDLWDKLAVGVRAASASFTQSNDLDDTDDSASYQQLTYGLIYHSPMWEVGAAMTASVKSEAAADANDEANVTEEGDLLVHARYGNGIYEFGGSYKIKKYEEVELSSNEGETKNANVISVHASYLNGFFRYISQSGSYASDENKDLFNLDTTTYELGYEGALTGNIHLGLIYAVSSASDEAAQTVSTVDFDSEFEVNSTAIKAEFGYRF